MFCWECRLTYLKIGQIGGYVPLIKECLISVSHAKLYFIVFCGRHLYHGHVCRCSRVLGRLGVSTKEEKSLTNYYLLRFQCG